jgi:hypothetical protein
MKFSISKIQDVNLETQDPANVFHYYKLDVYKARAYKIEDLIVFRDAITAYIDEELKEEGGMR